MGVGRDGGLDRYSGPYSLVPVVQLPRVLCEEGLCAAVGVWPEGLWDYSVAGELPWQRDARRGAAQRVCGACPVARVCAAFAVESRSCGVWGGVVFAPPGCREPEVLKTAGTPGRGARSTRRSVGARSPV